MDPELQKLVESGKLTSKSAEQLEELKPRTYCLHKSWGFGRVAEWNLLLNQIVIDFAGKKAHPMQLQYAAENLSPLAPEHFLARKAADLASTKKSLKKEGNFLVPAKKNEPIQLRATPVSHAEELIESFNQARQPKEQVTALDQIVKLYQEFKEPEKQLQPIIVTIENAAVRNQKLHPALTFEFVIARDELLERVSKLKATNLSLTLPKLIADEEPRLMSILPKLPAAKEK